VVTLVVAYQDTLPSFVVDFVKEYVFSSQKHVRLTLQMLHLDSIADLMRDGLKALGMLWVAVMTLTSGVTLLTRYIWIRRTQKKLEANSLLSGKLAPGEVLVPLHDPLVLEMNDDFSRFKHVYAFYLDLRCRSADDASRVALAMDGLKAALSAELIGLAENQVVQLKRDSAINALTDEARSVTSGGIVGVVLRSSDYNRIRKPESAVLPPPPPGTKPKVKMSTSWGGRSASGAPVPASGPLSAPPVPAAAAAAEATPSAEPVAEAAALAPLDPASLVAAKARDVLAGLRG
jgi:hypothetical protein